MAYEPETAYSGYIEAIYESETETGYGYEEPETAYVGYNEPENTYIGYDREPENAYVRYDEVVPSSYNREMNVSNEVENRVKSSYNDQYCRSSSSYRESYKAQEHVDKRTGQMGYKEEEKYTYNQKYVDKEQGYTFERETQVKFKDSVYPNKSATKSNNSRIKY
ncbi:uncharacterized protein Pyn_16628 [Prunus yedoensis var. nudiflora]|uniref:Uncharacterized protein n=1 Tax=Prunus yedoensis var. nudiflora TaxID=2094558 RepID=A0A314UW87_PRUYE|nr:uncharacterized protein Pyn_16628 [Prunus yedoensis var. nudiflora]